MDENSAANRRNFPEREENTGKKLVSEKNAGKIRELQSTKSLETPEYSINRDSHWLSIGPNN